MVDDSGNIRASIRFRFVADGNGAYKKTIVWFIAYARQVFRKQGTVSEIIQQSVSSDSGLLQGFVLHVVSRASKLDMLQHSLMHMKFAVRAVVLLALKPEKIQAFALEHLNNLAGGPWSFLNCVRQIALSCMSEQDSKEMRIRWPHDEGIQCAPCCYLSLSFFAQSISARRHLFTSIAGLYITSTSTAVMKPLLRWR